jgi:hypothetical protein
MRIQQCVLYPTPIAGSQVCYQGTVVGWFKTKKTFHPFYLPPFPPLICPPYRIQRKPCIMPRRMYSINISFKNYPSFNTTFPSMLTPSWYKLYFDTGKWGKESSTREKVRKATVHKAGSKLPT